MSAELKGLVTIDGVNGAITYPAIVSPGQLHLQGASTNDEADITPRHNAHGEVVGFRMVNQRDRITVTCFPSVASGTARADAKKALALPAKLSVVTLASFDEPSTDVINGSYIYEQGGTREFTPDGYCRMTLPLVRYAHALSSTLTAATT